MEKTIGVEIDVADNSTETGSLIQSTPGRMSNHEIETSSSVSLTFGEFARPIRGVTDPLSQQLAHLCELMRNLRTSK